METYKVPNFDLVLEKGMPVYISMLGMHLDPEYFPDPHKFDPERFSEEKKRTRRSDNRLPAASVGALWKALATDSKKCGEMVAFRVKRT